MKFAFPDSSEALIRAVKDYRRRADRPGPVASLMRRLAALRVRYWSMVTSSDVLVGARLGQRLKLPHPNGVVIHQECEIGDDCMIMQQVTIGITNNGGPPRIGSRVYIGAGAKVLGPIVIGDGAAIGANAVVLKDVPAGYTATGVPAVNRASGRVTNSMPIDGAG